MSLPIDGEASVVKRGRGRPRKSPRDTLPHEPVREPLRAKSGKTVIVGRDGEQLSRKRTGTADPFHIPEHMKEAGWDYQWIAVSVVGNTDVVMDQNLRMAENGWRPVPANRFPGMFMPAGYTGHIVRGGQGLYERPLELSKEARAEEEAIARRLISDRDQSLMGGKANLRNLPPGFEMGQKYRGTGGDIRISIDRSLDIPSPSHTLAGSED